MFFFMALTGFGFISYLKSTLRILQECNDFSFMCFVAYTFSRFKAIPYIKWATTSWTYSIYLETEEILSPAPSVSNTLRPELCFNNHR